MAYKAVVTVDEGRMRQLKKIQIQDYPELLTEEPFAQFAALKAPVPFNYQWIALQKNWLTTYFKNRGHTKVTIEHELQEDADGIVISWIIKLDEKQVMFGKFVVTGNAQIPFHYLQRELTMHEGQVWDKKKIEQSLSNLRNLELFDTVHIYAHKHIDDQGRIPVGVKLIAADKYEVRTRVGAQQVGKDFSLQQGFSYKAGGTLIMNNPFKFGDRVIFDADLTRFYENFSIQYVMPWLFHRPIRSQIKIYNNYYLQPLYVGSDVSMYNAFQQGILFGLQEKHEHINLGMSVGVEFKGVEKANIDDIAISIDYNPLYFDKKFAFFFAEPSFMWTNVDNIVNPKVGSNALLSLLAMADMQAQTSLFKLLGEYALYVPFTQRVVGAIRTRIGHIFNHYYRDILPIDRFYLGGANTIRGYERDYCPPLGRLLQPVVAPHAGLPEAADNVWRYVNQGGRTMLNCNFELRFPIYFQLEGAVYFDGGVLIKDSVQDAPNNMLGGVGFGFRYNTPIGPLRFDLAFKLDRKYKDFESPYVWYLTLGQAF
jgi:outer membrane protein assembly factor BamA